MFVFAWTSAMRVEKKRWKSFSKMLYFTYVWILPGLVTIIVHFGERKKNIVEEEHFARQSKLFFFK